MTKTPAAAPARLLAAALLFAFALAAPAPAHFARDLAQRPAAQTRDVTGAQPVQLTFADGTSVKLYARSHALVIGVSDYTHGWPDLPGVETDVREVSTALARHGFEVVTALNPTSRTLDQTIRDFVNEHGQDEDVRLVIYFAGHGHTLKLPDGREMGFVVPADAPLPSASDARPFMRAAVSMDEVELHARRITSKHALFVFDSCFSGSLFEANRAAPPSISAKAAQHVRQFITAGTAEQVVPDRSIFREQFVEAIAGEGDLDDDGYVTGSELGYFLETKVGNYTNGAQTPRAGKIRNPRLDKGDFIFETPHTPAPAVVSRPPAPTVVVRPPAPTVTPESPVARSFELSETAASLKNLLEVHAFFTGTGDNKLPMKALTTDDCTLSLSTTGNSVDPPYNITLSLKHVTGVEVRQSGDIHYVKVDTEPGKVVFKHLPTGETLAIKMVLFNFSHSRLATEAADYLQAMGAFCRRGESTPSETRPAGSTPARPTRRNRPL
jgi:hypothetical protein